MADYYTNFSVVLPLTKEQQAYAFEIAKQIEEHQTQELPTDFPASLNDAIENWAFETVITEKGLWLHSQYGGQDAACVFIQHLLQKFEFAQGVTFEWSHDCSQPRTDAFGGGAAFITATHIQTFTTQQWLLQVVGKQKHNFDPDTLCCTKCGKHMDDGIGILVHFSETEYGRANYSVDRSGEDTFQIGQDELLSLVQEAIGAGGGLTEVVDQIAARIDDDAWNECDPDLDSYGDYEYDEHDSNDSGNGEINYSRDQIRNRVLAFLQANHPELAQQL